MTMKRIFAIALSVFLIGILLASCAMLEDPIVASLGDYETHVYFTSGGFQDFTDYAKYYYRSAEVTENLWLEKIQETDLPVINKHLDDFEGWIETIGRSEPDSEVILKYDFDRSVIDAEDYFYIDSEERTWEDGQTTLVNYDVYFFDIQTQILYFFHNNI
jgi:hypothetical protein